MEARPIPLRVVPIFLAGHSSILPALVDHIERVFRHDVETRLPRFDPEEAFDPARGQYNSTILLGKLLDETPIGTRVLGVAGMDLFIPILTYVFGEAQLGGRAAILSTHRLATSAYGLPADEPRFLSRVLTEATHELGHTWGLFHCHQPTCAMRSSTYVEDIDLKSNEFCPSCAQAITLRA